MLGFRFFFTPCHNKSIPGTHRNIARNDHIATVQIVLNGKTRSSATPRLERTAAISIDNKSNLGPLFTNGLLTSDSANHSCQPLIRVLWCNSGNSFSNSFTASFRSGSASKQRLHTGRISSSNRYSTPDHGE